MQAKQQAQDVIQAHKQSLLDLSHRIHGHPELGFAETQASRWIADTLEEAGLDVERGICDLPTAFRATVGHGSLHVAICAEYDALPGIGHACGHNIIAAMAAGAGIGLARLADEADLTVTVIGTPAEEVGNAGGKILLLERGAFDGIHTSMMVHPTPTPYDDVRDGSLIATMLFDVQYEGKAAHAAAAPELGVNAADALTIAQVAVGLLRQQLPSTVRVSGISTHGGEAVNVIPARTTARFQVRAPTIAGLADLRDKVYRCLEAGALATGARLEIMGGDKPYAEMIQDAEIAALYRRNAQALGRIFPDHMLDNAKASSDMGNISQVIPSIHPAIGLDCQPAVNHQPEFTRACITPTADQAVLDGALAMAWTCLDLAADDSLRTRLLALGPSML